MNSLEKLDQIVERAKNTPPENEEQARTAQLVTIAVPMIAPMVPEEPAELDRMLLGLAKMALETRSDDAPRAELLEEAPLPPLPTGDDR